MTTNNCTLTQTEVKRLFIYNQATGDLIWKISTSNRVKAGYKAGCKNKISNIYYYNIGVKGKRYFAHRLIWLYVYGEWPDQIDHIDGNGLNNKLSNLRNVTHQDNLKNQRLKNTNTSGICGVYWCKNRNKWCSDIVINGKTLHFGRFDDFFEACCVRKSAEIKYGFHENHGQIRNL